MILTVRLETIAMIGNNQTRFYATWPGLTEALIQKYLPDISEEIATGHIHMQRQGVQSTQHISTEPELDGKDKITKYCKQQIGTHIVPLEEFKDMIATDQTGHISIVSIIEIQYIMILYNYNYNVILAQACRSRIELELVEMYNKV